MPLLRRSGLNNSAIFAETVPEHLRSTVYAFDCCFEGALGAPAAPLVGLVAERTFGFSGTLGQSVDAAQAEAHSLSNAHALGKAMLVLLLLPWGFDFFVYFGETLYFLISVYKIDGHASDAVNLLCRKGRCSPWAGTRPDICLYMACFIAGTLACDIYHSTHHVHRLISYSKRRSRQEQKMW